MKKSTVLSALNEFPKEINLDDFLERLIVLEKIEEGEKDVKEGKIITHDKVKKMVAKWHK